MEKTYKYLIVLVFFLATTSVYSQWTQRNPNYTIAINRFSRLNLQPLPPNTQTGDCNVACGQSTTRTAFSPCIVTTYSYRSSSLNITNGNRIDANFTGTRTVEAITTTTTTPYFVFNFGGGNTVYCFNNSITVSTNIDHSFQVTGINYEFSTIPNVCESNPQTYDLTNFIPDGNNTDFSGIGVQGTTWSSVGLSPGRYSITAYRRFDNFGAIRIARLSVLNSTAVSFDSDTIIACGIPQSPIIDLADYVNVGGGTFSNPSPPFLVSEPGSPTTFDLRQAMGGGNYNFTYDYVNSDGCMSTTSAVVNVRPFFNFDLGANQEECEGSGKIDLVAANADPTLIWSCVSCADNYVGDSSTFDTDQAPPGTYTVRATKIQDGCTYSDDKTFTVNPLPIIDAGVDETYCIATGSINLMPSPLTPTGGIWSGPSVFLVVGVGYQMILSQAGLGTHELTYTYMDALGCSNSDTKNIEILPLPLASSINVIGDSVCGIMGQANLSASLAGHTITWFSSDQGGTALSTGNNYSPLGVFQTTNYYVEATNSDPNFASCVSVRRKAVPVVVSPIQQITVSDVSNCGSDVVILTASGSGAGATYNWYTDPVGGILIYTGATYTTPILSNNQTYYVSGTSSAGCTSAIDSVVVTIHPIPIAPIANSDTICGAGTATISISTQIRGTLSWYSGETSSTPLTTRSLPMDTVYTTPNLTTTTSYWASITDVNGCISPRTEVFAVVNPIPPNPTTISASNCGNGAVTLTASGSGTGVTYNWYANFSGGTSLATGLNYLTPNLSNNQIYYVDATSIDGCTSSRISVDAIINAIPNGPTVSDASRCGFGQISLTAGGGSVGSSYRWYANQTGGSSFFTDTTYTPTLTQTTTYWVSVLSPDGCESQRASITGTINPFPAAPIANSDTICGAGTATISVSTQIGGILNWYAEETSILPLTTRSLPMDSSYTILNLTTTTSYWAAVTDANGCTSPRTEVIAVVNPIPPNPTTISASNCGNGAVTLTASGSGTGVTYNWYENSSGGTVLNTGLNYLTPNLSNNQTYYVAATSTDGCTSSRTPVDAIINAIPNRPTVSDASRCGFGQISLTAGGGSAGSSYRWYANETGGSSFFTGSTYTPILTQTTTYWVSVLSPDGCESQRASITGTINSVPIAPTANSAVICGVGGTATISVSTQIGVMVNWYETATSIVPLATRPLPMDSSYTTPNLNSTTSYWASITDVNGCISPRTEVIANVSLILPDPTVSSTSSCGSDSVTLNASGSGTGAIYDWYANPVGGILLATESNYTVPAINQIYYVAATSSDGCTPSARTPVEAIVNAIPNRPTVSDTSRCGFGQISLTAGGGSVGSSYRWYANQTGGSSFFTDTTYTPTLTQTTTYWVSVLSPDGCESPRASITGTVNPFPVAPIANSDTICGAGTATISVSTQIGGILNWYAEETSILPLTTRSLPMDSSYTILNLTTTTSYWAAVTDANGCTSPRTEVIAVVNPIPPNPTTISASNCGNGAVTLTASGSGTGVTYNWYENSSGGTVLNTGLNYLTPVLASNQTYYVAATSTDGCTSSRTPVDAIINAIPNRPTVSDASRCGFGQISLTAGGGSVGSSYRWYANQTGGSSFFTGSTYTPILTQTTTYWVSVLSPNGCESQRASITGTVNPFPAAPIANSDTICGAGSVTISISTQIAGTVSWYAEETSILPLTTRQLPTDSSYTILNLTTTTSYWAAVTDANGCTSPRTEVIAVVNPIPPNPTASSTSNCVGGSVTLTALGSGAGATYNWYANPVGGILLYTGANYMTSTLFNNQTYYVDATSIDGCTSSRISVDAIIHPVPNNPTVSDASICGTGQISLTVGGGSAGSAYRWYANQLGGANFFTGLTYTTTLIGTTTYWVSVLSADGCESPRTSITGTVNPFPVAPIANSDTICGAGTATISVSSQIGGTLDWYAEETSTVPLTTRQLPTDSSYTILNLTTTTSYWAAVTDVNGCSSPRTEVIAVVNPIPPNPTASSTSNCVGGSVTLTALGSGAGATYNWYANPVGGILLYTGANYMTSTLFNNQTYYVDATSIDGCTSSRISVDAIIHPVPNNPTVSDASICGTGQISLTVGGGSAGSAYRWYANQLGGANFFTGLTYTPTLIGTTTYWVSVLSADGCESPRTSITGTVNPFPVAPIANSDTICVGETATISVSSQIGGTLDWYAEETSTVPLATSQLSIDTTYTTPNLTTSTFYWAAVTDVNGCTSPRTEVSVIVYPIPPSPTVSSVSNCGSGSVMLTVSGSEAGKTYNWYANPFGGMPIYTGVNYTTPVLTSNQTYYVSASVDGCASSRISVDAIINVIPNRPTVSDASICGSEQISLAVGGGNAGSSYRWYANQTGGTSLFTGSTYTPTLTQTTTYWVSVVSSDGCEGQRESITGTVYSVPNALVGFSDTLCSPGTVQISVSSQIVGTINWYQTETSLSSLSTSSSYLIRNLRSTASYWASITDVNGCTSPRTEVFAVLNSIPPNPTISSTSNCGSGSVILTASGSGAGVTYNWYTNSFGGIPIYTGANYMTPILSSNRTYYVSATSTDGCTSLFRTVAEAIISPMPQIITSDVSNCGSDVVILTASGSGTGATYNWYANPVGGIPIYTGANYTTPILSNNQTYYVRGTSAAGCTSDIDSVVVTIDSIPTAPIVNSDTICGFGTATISVSTQIRGTLSWYEGETNPTPLVIRSLPLDSSYTTPNITTTTSYWVAITDINGCTSPRTEVFAVVNSIPPNPTASSTPVCESGSVILMASGSVTGATYNWYENPFGGMSIYTGANYTTPILSSNRTYYVSATSVDGCSSSSRISIEAIILPIPNRPTVSETSVCEARQISLTVGGGSVGSFYRWYANETGGAHFFTGTTYMPTLTQTTTYWVSILSSNGCESHREPITGTINPFPVALVGFPDTLCGPGLAQISVSSQIGGTINWYTGETSLLSLFTGSSYITPNLTTTTSYWAAITDANGCTSPRTEVFAVVNPIPPNPTVSSTSNCGNGAVTLTASGSGAGVTYNWYMDSFGGTPIYTGVNYTTPNLSSNQTYYVSATADGCTSLFRTASEIIIHPIPQLIVSDVSNCRSDVVILTASGGGVGATYNWYTNPVGGIPVYTGVNYTTPNLSSNRTYYVSGTSADGCTSVRDSVVVTIHLPPSVPIANSDTICGAGRATISVSTQIGGTLNWYAEETSAVSLAISTLPMDSSYTISNLTTTTSYWAAITDANGCTSPRTEVFVVVNPNLSDPTVSSTSNCGSGTVILTASRSGVGAIYNWYETPFGGMSIYTGANYTTPIFSSNRTYYVSATSTDGCTSSRTSVETIIHPIPNRPTVSDASVCSAEQISLTVGGGSVGSSYRWYANETGGTHFFTGTTYMTTLTQTTTYWVSVISSDGCESQRESITGTVYPIPNAPIANSASTCGFRTITISVSSPLAGIINWYPTEISNLILSTGSSYTISNLRSTTSYWAAITDANGCTSPRTEVFVTVNPIPLTPIVSSTINNCGSSTATLTASGSGAGVTYTWYENTVGGMPLDTGVNYTTPVLSSNRIYYVSATADGCVSSFRTSIEARIYPITNSPTVFNSSICSPGQISLTVGGGGVGSSYRWYANQTGGTSLFTGSTYTPTLTETTSYWVSILSLDGCEGNRQQITGTIISNINAPTPMSNSRCGEGTLSINVSNPMNGIVTWYQTETDNNPLYEGTPFFALNLSSTTSYWASITDANGCTSPRVEVAAIINPIPPNPTVSSTSNCGNGSVTLMASGSGLGATYEWYETSFGGIPLSTGENYTTLPLSSTRSYYVSAISSDGCPSLFRTVVEATIESPPVAPILLDGSFCGNGNGMITLTATGANLGENYYWYVDSSIGTSFFTGATYTTTLIQATSYWVSIMSSDGCESERSEIRATVGDVPDTPMVNDIAKCGSGTVILSATVQNNETINWYSNLTGGMPFATGPQIPINNLTENTTYYASSILRECESSRVPLRVTIESVIPVDLGQNMEVCLYSSEIDLTSLLPDEMLLDYGLFSGMGVVGNNFHPDIAGEGNHKISFLFALNDDIGCFTNGSVYITVINTNTNSTNTNGILNIGANQEISCVNSEDINFNLFANIDGGTWTSNAPNNSFQMGVFSPSTAGVGEYEFIYRVTIGKCPVEKTKRVSVKSTIENFNIVGNSLICKNEIVSLTIDRQLEFTDTIYWYKNNNFVGQIFGIQSNVGFPYISEPLNENTEFSAKVKNEFGCFSNSVIINVTLYAADEYGNFGIPQKFEDENVNVQREVPVAFDTDIEANAYLWILGNGANERSTRKNITYVYRDLGTYDLTLIVSNFSCIDTLTKKNYITVESSDIPLAINESINKNTIAISPVPFKDQFTIRLTANSSKKTIVRILDISGKIINQQEWLVKEGENTLEMNKLNNIAKGLYFVTILIEENQEYIFKKIIKK